METITPKQIAHIHCLLQQAGMSDETYREMLAQHFGATSCKTLSGAQARLLARYIYQRANPPHLPKWRTGYKPGNKAYISKLQIIKITSMWSRVTRAKDKAAATAALDSFVRNKWSIDSLAWLPRNNVPGLIATLEAMERQEVRNA